MRALERAATDELQGGIVYDALLMACARKIEARWIFTNNYKHFRRVAPDLAARIVEP
jgi:predicted nucleic acid-binding protein